MILILLGKWIIRNSILGVCEISIDGVILEVNVIQLIMYDVDMILRVD